MLKAFKKAALQTRSSEQEAHGLFNKLQNLKDILDQQEIDLLNWSNSPAKDRFYASHLKAKALVAQIADFLGEAARADQAASAKEAG